MNIILDSKTITWKFRYGVCNAAVMYMIVMHMGGLFIMYMKYLVFLFENTFRYPSKINGADRQSQSIIVLTSGIGPDTWNWDI